MMAIRDAFALASCFQVRRVLLGFLFLLIWTLTILSMIRHYSGGGWGGDWLEHFQRTLFFLHHFPKETPIIGGYLLPAGPPMMNLLEQSGSDGLCGFYPGERTANLGNSTGAFSVPVRLGQLVPKAPVCRL